MNKKIAMLVVLPVAALASACGGEEDVAYCVNAENEVIDRSYCAQDSDAYFWYYVAAQNNQNLHVGSRITKGHSRISARQYKVNVVKQARQQAAHRAANKAAARNNSYKPSTSSSYRSSGSSSSFRSK